MGIRSEALWLPELRVKLRCRGHISFAFTASQCLMRSKGQQGNGTSKWYAPWVHGQRRLHHKKKRYLGRARLAVLFGMQTRRGRACPQNYSSTRFCKNGGGELLRFLLSTCGLNGLKVSQIC